MERQARIWAVAFSARKLGSSRLGKGSVEMSTPRRE